MNFLNFYKAIRTVKWKNPNQIDLFHQQGNLFDDQPKEGTTKNFGEGDERKLARTQSGKMRWTDADTETPAESLAENPEQVKTRQSAVHDIRLKREKEWQDGIGDFLMKKVENILIEEGLGQDVLDAVKRDYEYENERRGNKIRGNSDLADIIYNNRKISTADLFDEYREIKMLQDKIDLLTKQARELAEQGKDNMQVQSVLNDLQGELLKKTTPAEKIPMTEAENKPKGLSEKVIDEVNAQFDYGKFLLKVLDSAIANDKSDRKRTTGDTYTHYIEGVSKNGYEKQNEFAEDLIYSYTKQNPEHLREAYVKQGGKLGKLSTYDSKKDYQKKAHLKGQKDLAKYLNNEMDKERLPMDVYSVNYRKLEKILPDLKSITVGDYFKLKSDGYMDLSVEGYGHMKDGRLILTMGHYSTQNGDLMSDPRMEIAVDTENGTVEALTYENHHVGRYDEVYDDMFDPKKVSTYQKKSQNSFLKTWLKNITEQGHKVAVTNTTEQNRVEEPTLDKYLKTELQDFGEIHSDKEGLDADKVLGRYEYEPERTPSWNGIQTPPKEYTNPFYDVPEEQDKAWRERFGVAERESRWSSPPKLKTYHDTFDSAVGNVREYAEGKGYDISDENWFTEVATKFKANPTEGKTTKFTLPLTKNGKKSSKSLNFQVYRMSPSKYELNAYIS